MYELEAPFRQATERVAQWVGAVPRDIALLDNATVAMNAVATSFPLVAGDHVLITDHDYGAVQPIWQRA